MPKAGRSVKSWINYSRNLLLRTIGGSSQRGSVIPERENLVLTQDSFILVHNVNGPVVFEKIEMTDRIWALVRYLIQCK